MVVEHLTVEGELVDVDRWLDVDEAHWTSFLERQPGFLRKEVWRSRTEPSRFTIVIWWESMAAWQAVPEAALDAVLSAMGEHDVPVTCVAHDVLRAR